ncbi:MAG: hypothetical protein FWD77_00795 [Betaproteobacteria bacterium]|nr:hypothetical protein [Betaproteobacteria bacterium]
MQTLILDAHQGWRWLAEGFRIYRKNPHFLALLLLSYWGVLLLFSLIPLLGYLAAAVFGPVFLVSLMNACRDADHGEGVFSGPPKSSESSKGASFPRRRSVLPVLFSGFSVERNRLLMLGAVYCAVDLFLLAGTALFDDGLLFQTLLGVAKIDSETPVDASLIESQLLWFLLLRLPMILALWYAPLLTGWRGVPLAKALFFSCVAVWRNRQAFLAYGLCAFLFCALLPVSISSLLVLILPFATTFITYVLVLVFVLIFLPVLMVSRYVSYRDVFRVDTNA